MAGKETLCNEEREHSAEGINHKLSDEVAFNQKTTEMSLDIAKWVVAAKLDIACAKYKQLPSKFTFNELLFAMKVHMLMRDATINTFSERLGQMKVNQLYSYICDRTQIGGEL